ncbi:hypothetical protein HJC23_000705 [Cyclotella cryptica]|uniref:Sodium/solute symporter n=1 Tax=Cyclotella cryptica TaxID=29204 RepID=A0ABD3QA72_9STRA|eukprot:CCRYP_007409-RD/>CCRYP_007409-RD protein AED:0.12 eAED:0.12 QI:141/1/1/1/0.88/0.8/10/303/617
MYDVAVGAAYAVLYTVLSVFTLLAIITAGYCGTSAMLHKLGCIMIPVAESEEEVAKEMQSADFFLAARNSASARAIGLSFFATGMGAWVVYGSTEMGANPNLSWLGVIGYSAASALPALIICVIGPRVRSITGEKAFCSTDFGLVRYGRVMQFSIAAISVFYMFIYMVSEMTSISNVYGLVVGKDTFSDDTIKYTTSIAISLAVFTWFYTSLAGLPASIVTDKFQAYLMASLVFILLIVACVNPENRVTKEEFAVASNWTTDGFVAAVTLIIAIACAEMFNQSTWQRVWAAKSVKDMRRGFVLGSFLVFLLIMFFGIMGMIAYANDPQAYDNYEKYAYLAFFSLLEPLSNFWHIVVLIIVTALAASSIDSLQTAIASILSSDILRFGVSDNAARFLTRGVLVLINIPAIILSSYRFDVIGLFLVADLVCGTAVLPVFLGLITEDFGFIPAPTELGAFLGILSGIAAVVVNGQIIGFDQAVSSITGEVIASGPFSYFWLTNSAECAVCGTTTMVTFIVVPLVAGFFTLFFSKLDIMIRGNRAREPIFKIAQTQKSDNYHFDKKEGMEMHVGSIEDEGEEIDPDGGKEQEGCAVASSNVKVDKTDSAEENNAQSVEVAA